jgi:diacylglycerol kinase (ATP)
METQAYHGRKFLLIVNPDSGTGKNVRKIQFIERYFKKHNIKIEIQYTGYAGHATEIAAGSNGGKYGSVIGCGGDGTINEVANGLAGTGVKMGIIPWGTGNVLAREMKFPRSLKKICKTIVRGKSMKMDLGSCNGRYFLLMASVGVDAYSLKLVKNSFLKKMTGVFAYAFGVFKAFINYKFPEIEVVFDNGAVERCFFILISNTSRYGRYFRITPYADPFDGLLDVIIYKEKGRLNFLKFFLGILWNTLSGNHKNNHEFFYKKNNFYRVGSLKVRSLSGNIVSQLDGDHFTVNDLNFNIRKKFLDVILPKKTIKKIKKKHGSNPGKTEFLTGKYRSS